MSCHGKPRSLEQVLSNSLLSPQSTAPFPVSRCCQGSLCRHGMIIGKPHHGESRETSGLLEFDYRYRPAGRHPEHPSGVFGVFGLVAISGTSRLGLILNPPPLPVSGSPPLLTQRSINLQVTRSVNKRERKKEKLADGDRRPPASTAPASTVSGTIILLFLPVGSATPGRNELYRDEWMYEVPLLGPNYRHSLSVTALNLPHSCCALEIS